MTQLRLREWMIGARLDGGCGWLMGELVAINHRAWDGRSPIFAGVNRVRHLRHERLRNEGHRPLTHTANNHRQRRANLTRHVYHAGRVGARVRACVRGGGGGV